MAITSKPYPAKTIWRFSHKQSGHVWETPLEYTWAPNYSSISDNWIPEEINADGLWRKWVDALAANDAFDEELGRPWVRITWYVTGDNVFELAPHGPVEHAAAERNFLSFYTAPVAVPSGDRMNWARLPVEDVGWRNDRCDKGGFIQEALGWKPGALQPLMHVESLARAAGLYWPAGR